MLLDNLGRKAWNNGTAKGIAILTQIGEISINISSELMISEICPIDRLMQRAGRLCRFDNSVGEMYALIPYKDNTLYPAPYGSYSQMKSHGFHVKLYCLPSTYLKLVYTQRKI